MSYLQETSQEMKERVMNAFRLFQDAKTADKVKQITAELEEHFREKLLESYNNGRKASRDAKSKKTREA